MKKFILLAFTAALSLGASAQGQRSDITAGFYRVQNVGSSRFAYVNDRTGKLNYNDESADMGAVALYDVDAHDRFCDPASVCYITNYSNKHEVYGQNISLHGIIGHYVQFQDAPDGNYYITPLVTLKGIKTNIYLKDGLSSNAYTESYVQGRNNETLNAYHQWKLIPVDNQEQYLGVKPAANMKVVDKYYKPYVVGFDMKISDGMKAYTVSEVKSDAVIIAPLTGVIPANTPVILECSSADASDNRVELQFNDAPATVTGNQLMGNYFCYGEHGETAYTRYNNKTMRVLAVVDGLLQFVTDTKHEHTTALSIWDDYSDGIYTYYCLNANESYLEVASGSAEKLPVMTAEEYAIWSQLGTDASLAPDIYEDGSVNVADANLPNGIAAMILEKIPAKYRADISKNGKVSIEDLCKFIQQLIDGKLPLAD